MTHKSTEEVVRELRAKIDSNSAEKSGNTLLIESADIACDFLRTILLDKDWQIEEVKEGIRKECERMKREVGQNHWDGTDLNSYKEGHNSALVDIITYLDTI